MNAPDLFARALGEFAFRFTIWLIERVVTSECAANIVHSLYSRADRLGFPAALRSAWQTLPSLGGARITLLAGLLLTTCVAFHGLRAIWSIENWIMRPWQLPHWNSLPENPPTFVAAIACLVVGWHLFPLLGYALALASRLPRHLSGRYSPLVWLTAAATIAGALVEFRSILARTIQGNNLFVDAGLLALVVVGYFVPAMLRKGMFGDTYDEFADRWIAKVIS